VGQQWAYNPDDVLRPIEECLVGLVCCAIGDGNLLFNVGPRPDGLSEESHAARLREMGEFLKKYGESIYATGGRAEVKQSDTGIQVRVPAAHRHAVDTIVKLERDGPAAGVAAIQLG